VAEPTVRNDDGTPSETTRGNEMWAHPARAPAAKVVAGAVAALLMWVAGAAAGAAAAGEPRWVPPDGTVTAVTGSSDSGFHVTYFGRSDAYLPTHSESTAECGEYRTLVRRVKCRVQVRTWYRDLRDIKRAIRYARLDQH
jgi:hypothetical protein